jgi:ribosome-binding factor A
MATRLDHFMEQLPSTTMAMCDGASSRGLRRRRQSTWSVVSLCILMSAMATNAFGPQLPLVLLGSQKAPKQSDRLVSSSALYGSSNLDRRSISGGGSGGGGGGYPFRDGKSKRQERVGQLVQTELSRILHTGIIKGDVEYLADALRCRISVVRADVSPDLRQARISVSVRPKGISAKVPSPLATVGQPEPLPQGLTAERSDTEDDRRLAYSWLTRHSSAIRHTVAQRMSHIKSSCPALTFVPVDVTAAVDVMHLIDQVTAGSDKRGAMIGWDPEEVARNMVGDLDDEDEDDDDDDDWEETDVDFFKPKS